MLRECLTASERRHGFVAVDLVPLPPDHLHAILLLPLGGVCLRLAILPDGEGGAPGGVHLVRSARHRKDRAVRELIRALGEPARSQKLFWISLVVKSNPEVDTINVKGVEGGHDGGSLGRGQGGPQHLAAGGGGAVVRSQVHQLVAQTTLLRPAKLAYL